MSEHEQRSEDQVPKELDVVEDLDVPEGQAEQVEGGVYVKFEKIDPKK